MTQNPFAFVKEIELKENSDLGRILLNLPLNGVSFGEVRFRYSGNKNSIPATGVLRNTQRGIVVSEIYNISSFLLSELGNAFLLSSLHFEFKRAKNFADLRGQMLRFYSMEYEVNGFHLHYGARPVDSGDILGYRPHMEGRAIVSADRHEDGSLIFCCTIHDSYRRELTARSLERIAIGLEVDYQEGA